MVLSFAPSVCASTHYVMLPVSVRSMVVDSSLSGGTRRGLKTRPLLGAACGAKYLLDRKPFAVGIKVPERAAGARNGEQKSARCIDGQRSLLVARSRARATDRVVSTGSAAYWERAAADRVLDRVLHLQGPCPEALRSPAAPGGRESRSMSSSSSRTTSRI
jgi:hypothetical protein